MISVEYRVPTQGLGTDFTTNERPITFAATYTNRFRNVTGGAERRPGMDRAFSAISGNPNLTRIHELVDKFGNETILTSDDGGKIWRYGIIATSAALGGVGAMSITAPGASAATANSSFTGYHNIGVLTPPSPGNPLIQTSAGGNDSGNNMGGGGLEIFIATTSGQITSLGAIITPGSGYSLGKTFTVGGFGVGAGSQLTITALAATSAAPIEYGWTNVVTGKSSNRLISGQSNGKLIFVNGVDRNFYTTDGSAFSELKALISTGKTAGGSNTTTLIDSNITNWIGQTQVANNDFVHNVTHDDWGIVTAVASASLTTTVISGQSSGDSYELIDYVDLNIIPDGTPNGVDNIATATAGTTTTVIAVSGVNFSTTEIRAADFIYNTTRSKVAMVATISANINLSEAIASQTSGDSLVFFKSAMPIASWVHVHYGRTAYLDSRDNTRVVFSAPDDPQDVTTYQQTLQTSSYSFGSEQPTGDIILSMTSFQRFFVASGKRNLYIYSGTDPIADTSTTTKSFAALSFYPNGVSTRFGLGTNGTDLLHITTEGLQAINIGTTTNTTVQNNVSNPVRNTMKNLIVQTSADNVQLSFYPRRNWLICKIGDVCYILNSNPSYDQSGQQATPLSWHYFSGKWAQQNHYFVRRNGDLLACGADGLVYNLDSSASTDDGAVIQTDLTTAWLRLEEPQRTVSIKQGFYIRPIFESNPQIEYTINANAGLDNFSSDSIVVSAGGTGQIGSYVIGQTPIGAGGFAQTQKYPLRWRGEQVQVEFRTNSSASPDIITSFTIYGDIGGRR